MNSFYQLGIIIYKFLFSIAAIGNKKARNRTYGLRSQNLTQLPKKAVLLHVASHGEYEQVKPLLKLIQNEFKTPIIISFFSPSGYNNVIIDQQDLYKIYLPFDTKADIKYFLNKLSPKVIILNKNEWWWNLIYGAKSRDIPLFLINTTIRKNHYFIKYKNDFFLNGLNSFSEIFCIDEESKLNLSHLSIPVRVAGDTKFESVMINQRENILSKEPSLFTIIYGSIWKEDLEIINFTIENFPNARHLIFPHDLSSENIDMFTNTLNKSVVIKNINEATEKQIYIANVMGILKYAYIKADLVYIGGGYGEGIHNVLEAAVYKVPIFVGPNVYKSKECVELIEKGAILSVNNPEKLMSKLTLLFQSFNEINEQNKLEQFFDSKLNASSHICKSIKTYIQNV